MTPKMIYQTDDNGKFIGTVAADESPLEPGVYLLPAGAIENAPPECGAGQYAVMRNGDWQIFDGPVVQTIPYELARAVYLNTVRTIREQMLNRLAGIGFSALLAADASLAQAIATARQALLDITTAPAVRAATDICELKAAVLDAFRGIVAAAPAELVRAFDAEGL